MTGSLLNALEPFEARLDREGLALTRLPLEILQVNVGKYCNQACHHCHVEAGPLKTEIMEESTARRIVELLGASPGVRVLDITGGAPELNANFRLMAGEARAMGRSVIDRCNLTVFFEPGQEDLGEFLRDHAITVVASMPCYSKENVDAQRGNGVFEKSIRGLRLLNELGYGREDTSLTLDLVYNPLGAFLPPPEASLEAEFKVRLAEDFGIAFNRLYTITNMPIRRFLWDLERSGKLEEYMALLVGNFNAASARGIMCRSLLSIDWRGEIYDCDFNQMLDLPAGRRARTIWDIQSLDAFDQGDIASANHCYGCTAGAGSSCTGAIA